jgi:hypothetical protein
MSGQYGLTSYKLMSFNPASIQPLNCFILQNLRLITSFTTKDKYSALLEFYILNLTNTRRVIVFSFLTYKLIDLRDSLSFYFNTLKIESEESLFSAIEERIFFDDDIIFVYCTVSISDSSKNLIFICVLVTFGSAKETMTVLKKWANRFSSIQTHIWLCEL